MTITAINGSPKGENSNSREVISIVQNMLGSGCEMRVVSQIKEDRKSDESVFAPIIASDVLLITFPLFVDAIPASMMRFMERYAASMPAASRSSSGAAPAGSRRQRVFAVVNCGFYEGVQNEIALDIVAHYCEAVGLDWCGGVGIGTGEMIRALRSVPQKAGIRKPVIRALQLMADAIAKEPDGRLERNLFTQHGLPWIFYKLGGEMGWRKQAKENGLKPKDLFLRPLAHS